MRRFWIEFQAGPMGLRAFGVSAIDLADAFGLLKAKVFAGKDLPAVKVIVEDIDVSTLDPGHVIPNMGNVLVRGVWFPLGYTPESRLSW
jgi:hypothetical protein